MKFRPILPFALIFLLGAECGPNQPKVTVLVPKCDCTTNAVQFQVKDLNTSQWVDMYTGPPDTEYTLDFSLAPGGPGGFRTRCYNPQNPDLSGVWVLGSSTTPTCP